MSRRIFESEYHCVEYDQRESLATVVRSPNSWPSPAAIQEDMTSFAQTMQSLPTRKTSVVIDLRQSSGRNDAQFERVFAPLRDRALSGFRRIAFIVSTQAGVMQIQRFSREGKLNARAFLNEADAHAWASPTDTSE